MSTTEKLLADIERYLRRTGMNHTRFGTEALEDHKFVLRLRRGLGVHSRSIDRVYAYIAANPASKKKTNQRSVGVCSVQRAIG